MEYSRKCFKCNVIVPRKDTWTFRPRRWTKDWFFSQQGTESTTIVAESFCAIPRAQKKSACGWKLGGGQRQARRLNKFSGIAHKLLEIRRSNWLPHGLELARVPSEKCVYLRCQFIPIVRGSERKIPSYSVQMRGSLENHIPDVWRTFNSAPNLSW